MHVAAMCAPVDLHVRWKKACHVLSGTDVSQDSQGRPGVLARSAGRLRKFVRDISLD